ncbi:LPXTG cell wall anchor domain-containing protein [Corynebacterium sp. HMSC28B08]
MNVSDVHKGDLPKTGGSGYYQSALAGMLLTIFGLLFLIYRRNTA